MWFVKMLFEKKTGAGNTSLEFWRGMISSGDFVGTAKRTLRTPWQNQLKDIIEVTQSTHTHPADVSK